VSGAGWVTRAFGTEAALLIASAVIVAAGALTLAWGRGIQRVAS
jgi:hypothetical protein